MMGSVLKSNRKNMQDPEVTRVCGEATLKLLAYCRANNWAGYEPYDATNSRIFTALPFLNHKLPRLVLTHALKRSPINFRRLLFIEKTQNPKALAVFLSALLKLGKTGLIDSRNLIGVMTERLVALRSPDPAYWCWGYSFPWQTRGDLVPRWAPNIVCTTFVADALLDAYEEYQESKWLDMAVSAAEYIVNELYWTDGASIASFSYPLPGLRSRTHNANFLASALLCRVSKFTGETKFLGPALAAACSSAGKQQLDGSWNYGEGKGQRWIDNFHTGYNLCALDAIGRYAETGEFRSHVDRGLEFYRSHFFENNGSVKYYHDRIYPIDAHCVSQAIITMLSFPDLHHEHVALAEKVFKWAMNHMWDDRGFFYFRVLRFGTNRISYIRWTQAWMLMAMSCLLSAQKTPPNSQNSPLLQKNLAV